MNEFVTVSSLLNHQNVSECNLAGRLISGLEVATPFCNNSFLSLPLDGFFYSITLTSLDGFSFLFAGTNDGNIYQVGARLGEAL